ncbi:Glutamine synthetase [Sigmodon hispidus]
MASGPRRAAADGRGFPGLGQPIRAPGGGHELPIKSTELAASMQSGEWEKSGACESDTDLPSALIASLSRPVCPSITSTATAQVSTGSVHCTAARGCSRRMLPPIPSLQLSGPGCCSRASRVLAACGPDQLCLAVLERAVSQARRRAGSRVVLICSPLAACGAAPGGGCPGVDGGSGIWSVPERTHALGGCRRLDPPSSLGGVTLWVVWLKLVVLRVGGAAHRLSSPTRGPEPLQYDRTMESQGPGVAGGLRSGEAGLGGGSSGARCLPRSLHSPPGLCPSGVWPPGIDLKDNRGPRVGVPTFWTFQWERAALKVDYPNSSGGGKRGSSPGRKTSKKPSIEEEEEDGGSRSSESPANCFGFVAYSVNSGEKSRVKVKSHQPPYSSTSPSERSGSPTPSPSPRKLRCLDQRDIETEEKHEHSSKKRRSREGNPNTTFDSMWLG